MSTHLLDIFAAIFEKICTISLSYFAVFCVLGGTPHFKQLLVCLKAKPKLES